jgi:hypothetical protein
MFSVDNFSTKVGNEASPAEERLRGHNETLDVLEWLVELRQRDDIDCCSVGFFFVISTNK